MIASSETDREVTLSDRELESLHSEDVHAAGIVVGLMTGVFMAGLLMYAVICWIAM